MEWVIIGQILIQFNISVLKCVCFFFDYKASIFLLIDLREFFLRFWVGGGGSDS